MHVRRLEQNCPYRQYENRDEIVLLSKVLWEYWFGWDRTGSETNPDQSPRRDHQSVACIGGNPYTQEQRMFVTGNVPNVVILVCSILHTSNRGNNIWVSNRWWLICLKSRLFYHDGLTSKSSFWLWRGFLFLSLLCPFFLATKDKKPQIGSIYWNIYIV